MPKVRRKVWYVFDESILGLPCSVCGTDKGARVPVITTEGAGWIETCFTCRRKDDSVPPA